MQRSSKPWLNPSASPEPGFSADVAKYAETAFYAAAAQIALAFTRLDASMVEELLKELHGTAGEIPV